MASLLVAFRPKPDAPRSVRDELELGLGQQSVPMKTAVAISPEEDFYVVSNLPPSRTQKRLALTVVLITSGRFCRYWAALGSSAASRQAFAEAVVEVTGY